jgi:stage V sporulation protein R
MKKILRERLQIFEEDAKSLGFDYFPIQWEVVSEEVLLEVMTYGLPTRARHWQYGQSYEYQKASGEMGYSKVYELILNNNPCYAFLLDTNSDIANSLVLAHCLGHSHMFKQNYLFESTDRQMVYHAAERAKRVDEYIAKYGLEEVEKIMDVGFALEKHIDWNKGIFRDKYEKKRIVYRRRKYDEFEDLLSKNNAPLVSKDIENESFPPHPEKDLLWFLINYAKIEPWQKDILEIIREESFYFYPQNLTKIMHEGCASYVHAELMYRLSEKHLTGAEYLEFAKLHERVVQPGSSKLQINPYFLGFTILNDIKEKWDRLFSMGDSSINGLSKLLDVCKNEDDISFLRNYLSQDICNKLEMFTYKTIRQRNGEYIEVKSTKAEDIAETMASEMYNYRAPVISIIKASDSGLELLHESTDIGTLDVKHLKKVMSYLHTIWGGVIDIESLDENGEKIHYTYDEMGFSH